MSWPQQCIVTFSLYNFIYYCIAVYLVWFYVFSNTLFGLSFSSLRHTGELCSSFNNRGMAIPIITYAMLPDHTHCWELTWADLVSTKIQDFNVLWWFKFEVLGSLQLVWSLLFSKHVQKLHSIKNDDLLIGERPMRLTYNMGTNESSYCVFKNKKWQVKLALSMLVTWYSIKTSILKRIKCSVNY